MTHPIDGYLLDGRPDKAAAIAAVLRDRVPIAAALPFYRALEAVGVRAADEALIALRLTLAGTSASDEIVRRVRGLAALAAAPDRAAIDAAWTKAGTALADLRPLREDPERLREAARQAYLATF